MEEEEWPDVNAMVTVAGASWEGALPTRVEDVEPIEDAFGRIVVVAAPHECNDPALRLILPAPASTVRVRWTHRRGLSEITAEVVSASLLPRPHWRLSAVEAADHIQRREYVRVPVLLKVVVTAGERTMQATTVDLSEGGIRCIVAGDDALEPEARVELAIEVEDRVVEAGAQLVRVSKPSDGFWELTARFVSLSKADSGFVRKYLFKEQAAQRRKLRDAC